MKLEEKDRVLLANATEERSNANAVYDFVVHHLVKVYQLPEGARISPDSGAITLPERKGGDDVPVS